MVVVVFYSGPRMSLIAFVDW